MKKVISLILSMAMVLSLTVLSFAVEDESGTTTTNYSIKIENSTSGHTYEAYQIFIGDLSGSTLSNIKWGSGVSEDGQTKLGKAADKAKNITTVAQAEAFAKEVAQYLTKATSSANSITKFKNDENQEVDGYVINNLPAGYYLVKDLDDSLGETSDSYTSYILKVVKDTYTKPKSDVPQVEKKVDDIDDSSSEENETVWQDSADYDIDDNVPFKLEATLPNNVSSYDKYKVIFHDTLSKGLTYNKDAEITINGETVTINETGENGFKIESNVNDNGETILTISCSDIKAIEQINSNELDSKKITVNYTAKLNSQAVIGSAGNPNKVYLEYSNNPNQSGEGDRETGKTPEDKVIVFTYKTVINKLDGASEPDENGKHKPLTGAEFTLQKQNSNGEWQNIKIIGNETTFSFEGLDAGIYQLIESKTPSGYNTIDPIQFKIVATHDVEADEPKLLTLKGEKISGEISFEVNENNCSLSADVVNNKGTTLPETGGIGTTIFYVVGAVLVIGAGVLFVTKRRMSTR